MKAFGRRAEIAGEYLHACIWKAASALSRGMTRKRAGRTTGIFVYIDRIEILDSRSTAMGIFGQMKPARSKAQSRKMCRSKRDQKFLLP